MQGDPAGGRGRLPRPTSRYGPGGHLWDPRARLRPRRDHHIWRQPVFWPLALSCRYRTRGRQRLSCWRVAATSRCGLPRAAPILRAQRRTPSPLPECTRQPNPSAALTTGTILTRPDLGISALFGTPTHPSPRPTAPFCLPPRAEWTSSRSAREAPRAGEGGPFFNPLPFPGIRLSVRTPFLRFPARSRSGGAIFLS